VCLYLFNIDKSKILLEVSEIMFHVMIQKAEDNWFVGECPALSGCVSQGKDEKEYINNIIAFLLENIQWKMFL